MQLRMRLSRARLERPRSASAVLMWVAARPFHRGHEALAALFNNWKMAVVRTYGSGRLVHVTVTGEANQDGQQHK